MTEENSVPATSNSTAPETANSDQLLENFDDVFEIMSVDGDEGAQNSEPNPPEQTHETLASEDENAPDEELSYDFDNTLCGHEHVYPAEADAMVIVPYEELPDHRATQINIPAMTIAFKRAHIAAPGIDDTGAKIKSTLFATHGILSQLHTILGAERYTKRYPSISEVSLLKTTVPPVLPYLTPNQSISKSTIKTLSNLFSTKLNPSSLINNFLSSTKSISSPMTTLSLSESKVFQLMKPDVRALPKLKTSLPVWQHSSLNYARSHAKQLWTNSNARESLTSMLNLSSSISSKNGASPASYAPLSASCHPLHTQPRNYRVGYASMTPAIFSGIEEGLTTVSNVVTRITVNRTPPPTVQTRYLTDATDVIKPVILGKIVSSLSRLLDAANQGTLTGRTLRAPLTTTVRPTPSNPYTTRRTQIYQRTLLRLARKGPAPMKKCLCHLINALSFSAPYVRYAIGLPITIVSINQRGATSPKQISNLHSLQPDILMVQEPHHRFQRIIRGQHNHTKSPDDYVFALVSHYNAIYIFNKNFSLRNYDIQDRYIRATVSINTPIGGSSQKELTLQSCYVPANKYERLPFFEGDGLNIRTIPSAKSSAPAILMGDFNDFPNPALDVATETRTEKNLNKRAGDSRYWLKYLTPLLDEAGLSDAFRFLHPDAAAFSFIRRREGKISSATRLDHALVSSSLLDNLTECKYSVCSSSDHHYIILKLQTNDAPTFGNGIWHLHPGVVTHPQFISRIRAFTNEALSPWTINPGQRPVGFKDWIHFKSRLAIAAKQIAAPIGPINKNWQLRAAELQSILDNTDWSNPSQSDLYAARLTELKRLRSLESIENQIHRQNALQLLHNPWHTTHLTMTLKNHKHNVITELYTSEAQIATDTPQLLNETVTFFQNLYQDHTTYNLESRDRLFQYATARVSKAKAWTLKRPLTKKEMISALHSCQLHSASGEDGLPFELWKLLDNLVVDTFRKAMDGACHSPQKTLQKAPFPVLLGTLLFKKGDRKDLKNYRPLSVMNSDLRWLAKAEANKLTDALDEVISSNQTAFLPNRQITDSVVAMMMLCDFACKGMTHDLAIFILDQEKAYDRVRRAYLQDALKHYGFPKETYDKISLFYTNPVIKYKVNNFITDFIKLNTGVLQGDPLACFLYLIALQPLLDTLNAKRVKATIIFPRLQTVTHVPSMAYADDLMVPLDTGVGLYNLFVSLDDYEAASHGKINQQKSATIFPNPEGKKQNPEHWHPLIDFPQISNQEEYVHLGCPLRADGQCPEKFLNKILNIMTLRTFDWRTSDLTELGCVQIANTYILPKLWHSISLCPLPPTFHS